MKNLQEVLKRQGVDILQTKYMSVELSIAAATAAGTFASVSADLDTNYQLCDGICFLEKIGGGLANDYKVAVRNGNGKVVDPIGIGAVGVDRADGSNPNDRFIEVLFDSKSGKDAILEFTTPSVTVGVALKVEAIFRLRKLSRAIDLPQ